MIAATGESARDAVRLFAVPGMLHCGGGEATDQFETLDAIMDWWSTARRQTDSCDEQGLREDFASLCPYPRIAEYVGDDPSSAASFVCRAT
jgi:feruloyl esterase